MWCEPAVWVTKLPSIGYARGGRSQRIVTERIDWPDA